MTPSGLPRTGQKRDFSMMAGISRDSNPRPPVRSMLGDDKAGKVALKLMDEKKSSNNLPSGNNSYSYSYSTESSSSYSTESSSESGEECPYETSLLEDDSPISQFCALSAYISQIVENELSIEEDFQSKSVDSSLGLENEIPEEWEEQLNDLEEGKTESIKHLLNNKSVKHLSEIEKKCISTEILTLRELPVYKNDYSLSKLLEIYKLALSNMELPLSSRNEFLKMGIDVNKLEIVNAAIEGTEGQDKIDFNVWSFNKPFFSIEVMKDKGVDPQIISKLISVSSLSNEDVIDGEWRTLVFNLWDMLGGRFDLKGESIEYGGMFFHNISSLIEYCLEIETTYNLEDIYQKIYQIFKNSDPNISAEEKIRIYEKTGSLLLHGGSWEHAITVLFYKKNEKDYFLICNIGYGTRVPIEVYEIQNKKEFNTELIKFIENPSENFDLQSMLNFYTIELPRLLSGGTVWDPLTDHFTKECTFNKLQKGDNCLLTSLMTSFYACSAMFALGTPKQTHEAFNEISKLDFSFKYHGLLNYLKYCQKNIERTDQNLINRVIGQLRSMFDCLENQEQFAQDRRIINDLKKKICSMMVEYQSQNIEALKLLKILSESLKGTND